MNLTEFLARRAALAVPGGRETCPRCRKALPTCYCHILKPFRSPVPFVILQHPDESRNAIATARMAHLSMTNSRLIVDRSFLGSKAVNELIEDPTHRHVLLYPSRDAIPMDQIFADAGKLATPPPVFWVLDAKWAQVPKMLRLSPNLHALPMAKFSPDRPSDFQIRRQPNPECLSTIEAIHLVIERFLSRSGQQSTEHHALLDGFQYLVRQQLGFVDVERDSRHRAAKALRAARRRNKQRTPKSP